MNINLIDLDELLLKQESYFENLIEIGLFFENSGKHSKTVEIYKKRLLHSEKAMIDLSAIMKTIID